jgi:septal ring factor EnvC (AmiA/AmiB activator)
MVPNTAEQKPHRYQGSCFPFRGAALFFLAPILLVGLSSAPLMAAHSYKHATVIAPSLKMRAGPGLYNPTLAVLPQGAHVLVLSYEGDWVRVLFNAQSGFIMNRESYLRIDGPGADPSPALASKAVDAAVRQPADVTRKLETSKDKVAAFSKEETAVINALNDTDKALDDTRRKVARFTAELKAVTQQIQDIQGEYRELEQRADTTEKYVAGRLAALYKLSWLGKFNVLASADSMFDFFTRQRAMQAILVRDEAVMNQLTEDKAKMRTLLTQLVARKNEKQTTTADLHAKIDALNAERNQRKALLTEIRSKKSLQLAAIESLKASAHELDRTVDVLNSTPPPPASPNHKLVEKPFEALKGLLMMPVKGKIVSFFGPHRDHKLHVTNFQSGINIKADRGEPIRAVYGGKTLFSSWLKGFGNMIIIDHGDHYYTVYAHLEEQFKSKGDPVETGEVIATVGDTGSMDGTELHFEIRHHGIPMNPLGWIKKG